MTIWLQPGQSIAIGLGDFLWFNFLEVEQKLAFLMRGGKSRNVPCPAG